MKKLAVMAILSIMCGTALANILPEAHKPAFAPVCWRSDSPDHPVAINHAEGGPVAVFIAVASDNFQNGSNGINIKNCGKVTHLDPGASAVCYIPDENNSINFSSDNRIAGQAASGTYQIEQKL